MLVQEEPQYKERGMSIIVLQSFKDLLAGDAHSRSDASRSSDSCANSNCSCCHGCLLFEVIYQYNTYPCRSMPMRVIWS